jgi:hypothetical protein
MSLRASVKRFLAQEEDDDMPLAMAQKRRKLLAASDTVELLLSVFDEQEGVMTCSCFGNPHKIELPYGPKERGLAMFEFLVLVVHPAFSASQFGLLRREDNGNTLTGIRFLFKGVQLFTHANRLQKMSDIVPDANPAVTAIPMLGAPPWLAAGDGWCATTGNACARDIRDACSICLNCTSEKKEGGNGLTDVWLHGCGFRAKHWFHGKCLLGVRDEKCPMCRAPFAELDKMRLRALTRRL